MAAMRRCSLARFVPAPPDFCNKGGVLQQSQRRVKADHFANALHNCPLVLG